MNPTIIENEQENREHINSIITKIVDDNKEFFKIPESYHPSIVTEHGEDIRKNMLSVR